MNNPVSCGNRTTYTLLYSGARCGPSRQQLQWKSAVDPSSNCTFVPAKGRSAQTIFFNLNLFGSCGVTPGQAATPIESVVCQASSNLSFPTAAASSSSSSQVGHSAMRDDHEDFIAG
eukprot:gene7591-7796_t